MSKNAAPNKKILVKMFYTILNLFYNYYLASTSDGKYKISTLFMPNILKFIKSVTQYEKELHRLNTLMRIEIEKIKGAGLINTTNTTDTWGKPGVENAAIFSAYLDARPEVVLEEVFNAESRNLWALVIF